MLPFCLCGYVCVSPSRSVCVCEGDWTNEWTNECAIICNFKQTFNRFSWQQFFCFCFFSAILCDPVNTDHHFEVVLQDTHTQKKHILENQENEKSLRISNRGQMSMAWSFSNKRLFDGEYFLNNRTEAAAAMTNNLLQFHAYLQMYACIVSCKKSNPLLA